MATSSSISLPVSLATTLPVPSTTSLPSSSATVVQKCATKRLSIGADSSHSSNAKRKFVHASDDKFKDVSRTNTPAAMPVVSSAITFTPTMFSIPETADTAHFLKDVNCSSDSNSEKELIIDEQTFDNPNDDLENNNNNNNTSTMLKGKKGFDL